MNEAESHRERPFRPFRKNSDWRPLAPRSSWGIGWRGIFLLSVLISSFIFAGLSGGEQKSDILLKVVDGDTLKIEHRGRIESIRLIGIDTPESRVNKKARKDAARNQEDLKTIIRLGQEATRYVKLLVKPGDPIRIEFDRQVEPLPIVKTKNRGIFSALLEPA